MTINRNRDSLELNKFVDALSSPNRPGIVVLNPDGTNIGAAPANSTVAIGSAPTIYAVVNTSAQGQASITLDTGVKFIGLTTTVIGSAPTLYAVVNTGAVGTTNSLVTLQAGPNQIGSVTISNQPTLGTGTNFIGLATTVVGNTVNSLLQAGTSYIGLASVNLGGGFNNSSDAVATSTGIAGVDNFNYILNNVGSFWDRLRSAASSATIAPNWRGVSAVGVYGLDSNSNLQLLRVDGAQQLAISPVTITNSNQPALVDSSAFIGLTTTVIGSAPTIFAVVNTAAAGTTNSLVTLLAGSNQIGSVTISNQPTIGVGANYIGLASVNIGGTLPALTAGSAFIGLATINIGSSNATLFAVVNTGAVGTTNSLVTLLSGPNQIGSVTISNQPTLGTGSNFIGLATTVIGSAPTLFAVVNTSAAGTTNSLATLLAGPNQIGSVTISNQPTLGSGSNYIGLASVNIGGTLPALSAGTNFIGLSTTVIGSAPTLYAVVNTSAPGTTNSIVTLLAGPNQIGSVTVSNPVQLATGTNYIGLATVTVGNTVNSLLQAGTSYVGLASVNIGGTLPALTTGTAFIGLATVVQGNQPALVAGTAFIGLATVIPAYTSNSTSFTGIISAAGNSTIFVAPAATSFFLKSIHIASLGRSEVEIRSGATQLIPFTSLSTTAGYFEYYGEVGLQSRAQADSLVIGLNSAATISYMANVRFGV